MTKKGKQTKSRDSHSTKEHKTVKIKRRGRKQKSTNYIPMIVGVVAIIIIAFIIGTNLTNKDVVDEQNNENTDSNLNQNNDNTNSNVNTNTGEVVAMVNGKEIYLDAIDEQYALLPPLYQQIYSKRFILNKTIEEELLIMKAEEEGLEVTEEEAQAVITDIMTQQQITEEQLEEQLAQSQKTKEDLVEVYKKQILITNLLNDYVFENIEVTQDEVAQYYEDNKESELITVPHQVRARHILVDTQEEADEILALIKDGESFSELAQERSKDTGSQVQGGDLGYFSFGMMVEPFNGVVFGMHVGDEARIVETEFGFHIVEVTGVRESTVKTLEEVNLEITEMLKQEQQEEELMKYIQNLWDEADIEVYDEKIVEEKSAELDIEALNQGIIQ